MRIIFEDDIENRDFEYFVKKKANLVKACQIKDDFKIYKEGKGFFAQGKAGDYLVLGPLKGFYIIGQETFEKYYGPFHVFETKDNVISFREYQIKKNEDDLE